MGKIFEYFKPPVLKTGGKGSTIRHRSEIQDFKKIRNECLRTGKLFEDDMFPAVESSVYFTPGFLGAHRNIEWKRPSEICKGEPPRLVVEGASRFDVCQGLLGDCWFLSAVANLTLNQEIFFRVVPKDQSFTNDYAGIFHFHFWQYGHWIDIVIDDRLPMSNGQLLFTHSKTHNEFWSALLEKAYAKLNGSYEALQGGLPCESMEDFTGGVTETYDLKLPPSDLYTILLKAYDRWSLMNCVILPDPKIKEAQLPNGLIKGHAYSITKVKIVKIEKPKMISQFYLLRVRNPWGNQVEWKGAWSDRSEEWKLVSEEEKKAIRMDIAADGEFWISYDDFIKNFDRLEICNLSPDALEEKRLTKKSKKKWEVSMFEGSWIKNCTAGGCLKFRDTIWMNPQFRIDLEDPDENDVTCTLIVSLMQKNRRWGKQVGQSNITIGYTIYELKNADALGKPLPQIFFLQNVPKEYTPSFDPLREVCHRYKLPPGTYCIVPSTFNPGEEGEFLLRVFTEKENNMTAHDENIGVTKPDDEVRVPDTHEEKSKDEQMKEYFEKIAGKDGEVDCYELKKVLDSALKKETNFDGFSLDVCRSMVAMMDVDRTGKLGLEEFKTLIADIKIWKNAFKKYDLDKSGSLSTIELRAALRSAGFTLNVGTLRALVLRYGKKGTMSLDDFIHCAVKLKMMIGTFQARDPNKTSRATFTLGEWIEKTMYS